LSQYEIMSKNRADWLMERRTGIGGSDVPAILGISPYASPYTVWADKLGLLPEREYTEAMRQGVDLEAYVSRRFCEETGLKAHRKNQIIRNPAYPYSLASIDRRIVGERAGLEIKTCSPFRLPDFNDDEYPPEYLAQCLHYLAVTGWVRWYLAVLILGTVFKVYQIDRADYKNDIEEIQRQVYDFWTTYVIPKVAPPVDGTAATGAAIASIYNSAVEGSVDLSGMEQHFVEISILNEQQKALEKEKERHKQNIKIAMGENIRGECSCYVANWRPRKDGTRVFTIAERRGA